MSQIYDDFKKYRDRFGMNQLETNGIEGGVSQNGALFTMEYLLCLLNDETATEQEKRDEIKRVYEVMNSLEVLPGLSRRTPESGEGDSMDNNGSLLVFSALYGNREFAKRMYEHGKNVQCDAIDAEQDLYRNLSFYPIAWILELIKTPSMWFRFGKWSTLRPKFFWNNTQPTKFCLWGWFGRSPGFTAKAQLCATGDTSMFGKISMWVGQFLGCFAEKGDTDARKLPYVNWQLLKMRGGFWALSYKLWCWILMKQYPNGMRDVYDHYYRDPNHPIKKYSKPFIK